jgi:hypothetical protein
VAIGAETVAIALHLFYLVSVGACWPIIDPIDQ